MKETNKVFLNRVSRVFFKKAIGRRCMLDAPGIDVRVGDFCGLAGVYVGDTFVPESNVREIELIQKPELPPDVKQKPAPCDTGEKKTNKVAKGLPLPGTAKDGRRRVKAKTSKNDKKGRKDNSGTD